MNVISLQMFHENAELASIQINEYSPTCLKQAAKEIHKNRLLKTGVCFIEEWSLEFTTV